MSATKTPSLPHDKQLTSQRVIGCDCALSPFPLSHSHLKLSYNRLIDRHKTPRATMDEVKYSREPKHNKDQGSRHLCPDVVKKLIHRSHEAKKQAYCPYSTFRVGAALMTFDNRVFTGTCKTWHLGFTVNRNGTFKFYFVVLFLKVLVK